MAGLQQFNETHPNNESGTLDNALGTGQLTFDPPFTVDWRMDALIASNTDAIDHVVNVYYAPSGSTVFLTSQNVPAGAGVAGAPAVNLFAGLPTPYDTGLPLGPNDEMKIANDVGATVAGSVFVMAIIATL